MNTEKQPSTGTVDRVALMLKFLAEAEGDVSVSHVAEQMQLPTSTAHRLLGLLVQTGLAERGERTGTYRTGLEFFRLGGLVVSRREASTVAERFMQKIVDVAQETCAFNMYVASEQRGMLVKVIHGPNPLRYESPLFHTTSLCFGAPGHAILAFLPPEDIDEILSHDKSASPVTGNRLRDANALRRELIQTRERGYSRTQGELLPGAIGFAAPVFDDRAFVVGSLCIILPETRFAATQEEKLVNALMEQAISMSRAMGFSHCRVC